MKRHTYCRYPLFFTTIAFLATLSCDNENEVAEIERIQFPILDGLVTYEYPAVGKILPTRCTGTLITTRHVLTAAHCCEEWTGPTGTHSPAPETFTYETSSSHSMPMDIDESSIQVMDWTLNHTGKDVCVFALTEAVIDPAVVPLPIWPDAPKYLKGLTVTQIGYGLTTIGVTSTWGTKRKDPQKNQISWVGLGTYPTIEMKRRIALGGDSGSPAIVNINGIDMIAGVYSNHGGPCQANEYALMANLHYDFVLAAASPDYIPDADEDTYLDSSDKCPAIYDSQDDTDGDGRGNDCDICPLHDSDVDSDILRWKDICGVNRISQVPDGIPDSCGTEIDNCITAYNPDQFDSDGDGVGDACDLCKDADPTGICATPTDTGCIHPPSLDDYGMHTTEEDKKFRDDVPPTNLTDFGVYKLDNDVDADRIGNLCDNCLDTPNNDQTNCNALWERTTREPSGPVAEQYLGDACDPEPCSAFHHRRPDILNPFYRDWGTWEYCMGYPEPWSVADLVTLRNPGYADEDRPHDTFGWYVQNGFCDCGSAATIEECRAPEICPEEGTVDPTFGWHPLYRGGPWTGGSTGPFPGVYRRLYGDPSVTDPDPLHGLTCEPLEDPYEAFSDPWGCDDSDYSKFYAGMRAETGTPGPGFSSLQGVRWKWQDDPELGCGGTTCSKNVRLLAKPLVTGWVAGKNASYFPHFDPYATTTTPPRPLTLAVFCPPFRAPPERLGTWVGRYIGWWEDLITMPPERLADPDVFVMESFHVDMPEEDVGEWRYSSTLPSSLSQGLLISQFSLATGQFTGFYKSAFSTAGDIIDVMDYAFVQISRALPPHDDPPHDEVVIGTSTLPELWVFGGKDIDGPRGDLWRGVALQSDIDGEVIYTWVKTIVPTGQFEPPALVGSAMFYDPQQDRLVVWGGESIEGPSNDIYYYNIGNGTWTEGSAWGDQPPKLLNAISAQSGQLGYIWGGIDENGNLSSDLYLLDISEMRFHQIRVGGNQPPQLRNASLWVDPSNHRIYLYGGHDGTSHHNWIWSYTISEGGWKLVVSDCVEGVCPDLTDDPLLLTYKPSSLLAVVPGTRFDEPLNRFVEHSFRQEGTAWKKQSDFLSSPADSADCNGDGIAEPDYGMLCAGAQWWDFPGTFSCDVPTQNLVCNASVATPLDITRTPSGGAKAFAISNHNLLYTRGSSFYSVDTSEADDHISLDEISLGNKGGDIALQSSIAAVAADESIHFIDANNPSSLIEISSIGACGRVMGVEYSDDHLYYITRVGIGDIDVSDPTSPYLARFSWILPATGGGWEVVDFDPSSCSSLYALEDAECDDTPGCLGNGIRPFQVAGTRAFFAFHKDLVKVDISQTNFAIDGYIDLGRRIENLLYENGYVYLTLVGHRTQVIDAWTATPEVVGSHDLIELVAGVQYEGGRSLKLDNGKFWIATLP